MFKLVSSAIIGAVAAIVCKVTFVLALIATGLSWLDIPKAQAVMAPLWWTCLGSFVVCVVFLLFAAYFSEA